ncbi:cytochrome ubiquinol oxidase subunit I, partial [Burkholderia glumae]|uniref:cytochrome ubiquinol oxidase subunit I n=1 Tax=Burkholderia glumae TaxID=337 RepID=UPI000CB5A0CD
SAVTDGTNRGRYERAQSAGVGGLGDAEQGGAALTRFGSPGLQAGARGYALQGPHLGSLILTHSWNGEIRGLKSFAPEDRPNSTLVFWTFRVMVALGFAMIGFALAGWLLRRRGRLYEARWFHRLALVMGPSGFVTLLAGWITTEAGRQPWVVYGVMRTADAASPLSTQQVGLSLMTFVLVYFLVFGTGIYYLLKLIDAGPALPDAPHTGSHAGTHGEQSGRRPLSAPDQPIDAA